MFLSPNLVRGACKTDDEERVSNLMREFGPNLFDTKPTRLARLLSFANLLSFPQVLSKVLYSQCISWKGMERGSRVIYQKNPFEERPFKCFDFINQGTAI